MKKVFYFTCIIFISIACANNTTEKDDSIKDFDENPSIVYNYDSVSTEIKWTAFKHMDRIPVGGKFDAFTINGFEPADNISDALKNVSFSINTASTNTQDKDRDLKIVTNFFGNMQPDSRIEGRILEIKGAVNGSGSVLIQMNGVGIPIKFEWKLNENNQFILNANLSVLNWDLAQALEVLNEVCLEKHTGKDGVSKLWADVEVTVFTTLKKTPSS